MERAAAPSGRVDASRLRAACDPATFPFASTADLPALDGIVGQERATRATRFGIGMRHAGYNLFVLGPPATGKTRSIRRVIEAAAREAAAPPDWCYVHNFTDPYRPVALALPAGRGRELRAAMQRLVDDCKGRVPRAFEGEAFGHQKARILDELTTRQKAEMAALEQEVEAQRFVIVRTPGGLAIAPARDGKALGAEDFAALPEAEQTRINAAGTALNERLEETLRRLREHERDARDTHGRLVHEVGAAAIRPLVQEVRERFTGLDAVARYLEQVAADLIEHAEEFAQLAEQRPPALPWMAPPGAFLERYRVNVLVDRTADTGAPVIVEEAPSFANLVGRIEHHVQFGTLVTDFTLLQAGALHRANGGYLLLEVKDVLAHPGAWQALKKAIESHTVRIEEPFADLRLVSATSLAPEPIPLDVKVVLIGNPYLYYLFHALDEDFRALFKVKVDFDDSLPRTPEFEMLIARFVGDVCREEGLRHFAPDGVARLIEHCSRTVWHQDRLTSRLGDLIDLIREAVFWSATNEHALVRRDDVARAVDERRQRANLVEERLARMTAEGTLAIATAGEVVGQVNGLAVLTLGDHAFGRPTRITARTFLGGEPGVVDIEREAKLGGPLHSKGVMILTGFLAGRHARARPLALSATLTFEQQYESVEGDSASAAELCALLSSIAGLPLRQDLAITGAVNQHGDVQAVGGVNEKIESFFDLCLSRGLSGRQGVIIPAVNTIHLMLRDDVVEAVRAGTFHVHAVASVDEAIALLSGRAAGERDAEGRFAAGTVNAAIDAALDANVERLRALRQPPSGTGA
ncbi:MAG TPA: ATP-binding protein [Candidatus Eisenbacteria bacterium]|nr:ATP-binding protein [Candidatus Eisenbacteria bacterium]